MTKGAAPKGRPSRSLPVPMRYLRTVTLTTVEPSTVAILK
jgi:hypothetical protein